MKQSFESKLTSLYTQFSNLMGKPAKPSNSAQIRAIRRHTGSSHRLNEVEREQVVAMLKTEVPVTMIAKIFKISRPSVYNIRDNELPEFNRHGMASAAGK